MARRTATAGERRRELRDKAQDRAAAAKPPERREVTSEGLEVESGEEDNVYAAARNEGHKVDPRAQVIFVLVIVLVVVYLLGLVLPKNLFYTALQQSGNSNGYTLSWFVGDLQENVNGLVAVLAGNEEGGSSTASTMILFLVVAMTGSAMALSGAVYQGSFKNALVTPSTLGVMTGASLGMAFWVVFIYDEEQQGSTWFSEMDASGGIDLSAYLSTSFGYALCCFIGCLLVVGLVLLVVRLASSSSVSGVMMIITGQVIGGIMGAIVNTMRYYYVTVEPDGTKATLLMELQISSFYRSFTIVDVIIVGAALLATFAVVMHYRSHLELLSFSEGEARSMGVETRRVRFAVVALCTLLTAIVVSFCGHVGFVGFLVPHLARRLVGPDNKYLLPASVVLGAVFVLGSYVLVWMTLGSGYVTMTGMYISIFGAVVFLVTAIRGGGEARGEFR